jgi:hypothetical protein
MKYFVEFLFEVNTMKYNEIQSIWVSVRREDLKERKSLKNIMLLEATEINGILQ